MSQYILNAIKSLDLSKEEDLVSAVGKVQELSELYSRSLSKEDNSEFKISDPNIIEYSDKEQVLIEAI